MTPEGQLTAQIRRYLDRIGAYVVKQWGGPMARPGVPDILACAGGTFIGIEVKQPGRKPTDAQRAELDAIRSAGGVAVVAYRVEDVRAAVEPLLADAGQPWQPALLGVSHDAG